MDSKLQYLSNGTKNTQIEVRMTKLWPYEVREKAGDCSNVATSGTNVATLQNQSISTSRRLGLVLGGLFAHFEPIMEGFKAKTLGIEKGEDL